MKRPPTHDEDGAFAYLQDNLEDPYWNLITNAFIDRCNRNAIDGRVKDTALRATHDHYQELRVIKRLLDADTPLTTPPELLAGMQARIDVLGRIFKRVPTGFVHLGQDDAINALCTCLHVTKLSAPSVSANFPSEPVPAGPGTSNPRESEITGPRETQARTLRDTEAPGSGEADGLSSGRSVDSGPGGLESSKFKESRVDAPAQGKTLLIGALSVLIVTAALVPALLGFNGMLQKGEIGSASDPDLMWLISTAILTVLANTYSAYSVFEKTDFTANPLAVLAICTMVFLSAALGIATACIYPFANKAWSSLLPFISAAFAFAATVFTGNVRTVKKQGKKGLVRSKTIKVE